MTLIDALELRMKIKMREDRIIHNLHEIMRLQDQNIILRDELKELKTP